VHTGKVFASTPVTTGIKPFMDLAGQVMARPEHKNASRVSSSSITAQTTAAMLEMARGPAPPAAFSACSCRLTSMIMFSLPSRAGA
jgi:hypothetical protein